jgi:hypothetical protein
VSIVRRAIALSGATAVLASLSIVFAGSAGAAVTTPTNGSTIRGTITATESPGGSDQSSILGVKHCSGNTSTQLLLINSGNSTVSSTSNSGGVLNWTLRTESFANGTYTIRGVENYGENSGFLGLSCSTSTQTFNNTVHIDNVKSLTYTGDTSGIPGTNATVSAKVVDPNDGNAALSGQTVTFVLSGGSTVNATTNASGVASTTLPIGTPARSATLTVSTPATSFFDAASTTVPFTVDQVPTSVAVTPPADVVHGQSTQFTATLTPSQNVSPAPTGTIQFKIDDTDFGSPVPLSGLTATSGSISTLSTANHAITAVYSGDSNYAGSTSPAVTQHVGKASTSTSLSSSLNPSFFGQSVTFSSHVSVVSPGVGTPTGGVQFTVDGSPFGTAVPLDGSNNASVTISSLHGGNHDVTATYTGDDDFATSTSPLVTQGVNRAATDISLDSSNNPSVTGQPVTFTVSVSPDSGSGGPVTGQVQFQVDGNDLGGPVSLSGGSASSPSVSDLTVGQHVVSVDYLGSSDFAGNSTHINQHVNQAATTTSIDSAPNPSVFGQPVTFSASVAPVAPGAGTPTGQVQFFVDGVASGDPVDLSGGSASSDPVSDLSVGSHDVTAQYLGDAGFAGSTSDDHTQTVNKAASKTVLTSSVNPSVFGQPVTLTATVSAVAPGAGNPTGTVTFTDGANTLGTVDVGPDTAEQASITVDSLEVGPHAISASYSGDGNFLDSSDALTQTVTKAHSSTVLTASKNPIASGETVTFTATVSAVAPGAGTPGGSVTFLVNGVPMGDPVTLSDGSATSAPFASLTPGTYSIEAAYSGDNHFVSSTGDLDEGTGLNVTQAASTTSLVASPSPADFGATVMFTATVSAVAPGSGRPTGIVDFYDGQDLLGAASLAPGGDGSGVATFTSSTLDTGTHAITATYVGNFNFTGSSAATSEVVGAVPTVTGLSVSPGSATYGDVITLTAVVATNPAGNGSPNGQVTFTDNGNAIGTATLQTVQQKQVATLTVPGLDAGAHAFQASYAGNAQFQASTSPKVGETIARATANLTGRPFIVGEGPDGVVIRGQAQATLTGNGGAPLAGQTIVFSTHLPNEDGTIHSCTATTDSNGVAMCPGVDFLQPNSLANGFDITFAGNQDYQPVTIHEEAGTGISGE